MNEPIQKGQLLVAMPGLSDPNFFQTVVLLCSYGTEGALGVILNRPTEIAVSALIHDFHRLVGMDRIYEGGPVAKNGVLVLCRGEEAVAEGSSIVGNIFLAKDIESLKRTDTVTPADIRCYMGYAGWVAGQLEAEVQAGAWKTVSADPMLVFDIDPFLLWPQMMRRLGPACAFYATMPPNPSMN